MEVAIPHNLDKETVRNRLRTRSHKIADAVPGGMAEVVTGWPSEDRMSMSINAMGQSLTGYVDIQEGQIVMALALPASIGFMAPMIENAIRQQGQKLIAPGKDEAGN
jgi:hypothetical protein